MFKVRFPGRPGDEDLWQVLYERNVSLRLSRVLGSRPGRDQGKSAEGGLSLMLWGAHSE